MKSSFKVSARTLNALGKESIKDRYTAILELVKNSYDADSTKVFINLVVNKNLQSSYIEISDDGHGMTEDAISKKWLIIGTSEKISKKTTTKKRRNLGEKGVGRLSCAKLAQKMELVSSAKDNLTSIMHLDWNIFNDPNKTLDEIPVIIDTKFNISHEGIPGKTGLYLKLSNLYEKWEKEEVENLALQLRLLFSPVFKAKNFEIFLKTNMHPDFAVFKRANIATEQIRPEISLESIFKPDEDQFTYTVTSEFNGKKLIKETGSKEYPNDLFKSIKTRKNLGEIKIRLKVYTRSKSTTVLNPSLKTSDIKNFLENNSGVRLFRDQVRVRPYGEPRNISSDWLGLAKRHSSDPAGVSRKTYKINESQIIGEIEITKDGNPFLMDNTSREGLVDNEYFRYLKDVILNLIEVVEATRHNALKTPSSSEKKKQSQRELTRELDIHVNKALKGLDKAISIASEDQKDDLNEARENVKEVRKIVPAIKEIINDVILFRSLASVGIVSSVFAHEVRSDLGFAESVLANLLHDDQVITNDPEIRSFVEDAYKRIEKVSMWGVLTLNQLGARKRQESNFNISNTLEDIVKDFTPILKHSNIDLIFKPNDLYIKAYMMDIESIVVNLLTNARHAAIKNQHSNRKIFLEINKDLGHLYFSDSGKGVPFENVEKIWKPLFTTKSAGEGTGLGLTIVRNIATDLKVNITVGSDLKLKGALFCIDFSGVRNV